MKLSIKKIFLLSSVAVLFFVSATVILALFLIDPNDYKQTIQTQLSEQSGFNIIIPGDIELAIFPQLNLEIGEINIRNRKEDNFLSIDTHDLKLKIKLLSLFSGEPKIGSITAVLSSLQADKNQSAIQFKNIELSSSGFKSDQLARIVSNLDFLLANNTSLPISLKTNLTYRSNDKSVLFDDIKLSVARLKLKGKVVATPIKKQYKLNGSVATNQFSLREMAVQLGSILPVMKSPHSLEIFSIRSKFSFSDSELKLDKLKATLDKTNLTGNMTVKLSSDKPVQFELSANKINLDDYRLLEINNSSSEKQQKKHTKKDVNPFAVLALNLNGNLRLDKLQFSNLKLNDILLNFVTYNKTIKLSPSAKLYNGLYAGELSLTQNNKALKLSGKQKLENVNIEPLLIDYMGEALVSGKTSLNLNFNSEGSSAEILLNNMLAKGDVKLADSQLKSIKLARALLKDSKLKTLIKKQSDKKEVTVFDSITASFNIKNGIANNNDFLALSKRARITGAGDINLVSQTLNYTAQYHYNKSHVIRFNGIDIDLKDKPLPVHLSGPIANPKYDVKTKALLSLIKNEYKSKLKKKGGGVEEKYKDKTKDIKDKKHKLEDKIKNKLKGLFK